MNKLVEQSRWGVKTRFDFGDVLDFVATDPGGSVAFQTGYEAIDLARRSVVVRKAPRLIAGLTGLSVLLFVGFYLSGMVDARPALGLVWLATCGVLAVPLILSQVTEWFDVRQTLIPVVNVPGGVIRIVHDGREEEIVAELTLLRRERVRAMLGTVDLAGDLAQEAAKVDWLLANHFIDTVEHADMRARIVAAARPNEPFPTIN